MISLSTAHAFSPLCHCWQHSTLCIFKQTIKNSRSAISETFSALLSGRSGRKISIWICRKKCFRHCERLAEFAFSHRQQNILNRIHQRAFVFQAHTKLSMSFIFEYTALLHSLQLTNRISTIAREFHVSSSAAASVYSLFWITRPSFNPLIGRILFAIQKSDGQKTVALCWRYLSSQAVASQVLSTEMSLTTVFGMGTGGPSS